MSILRRKDKPACGLGRRNRLVPLSFPAIVLSASISVHQRPLIWAADERRCTLIIQLRSGSSFLATGYPNEGWRFYKDAGKLSGIGRNRLLHKGKMQRFGKHFRRHLTSFLSDGGAGGFSKCHLVCPQSDSVKFERPLPCGHGSVESVCYRAVTARERSFDHRLPQQRLECLQGCGQTKWHCPLACERSDLRRFLP